MGKLIVYNFITVNGYFKGRNEDISWAKQNNSEEENKLAAENAGSGNLLLFGRKTYEMMAAYWPSAEAIKNAPELAAGINNAEKIVFSKTLRNADWNNTRIIKENMEEEVKKRKETGQNMTVLGSGTIVTQLADAGLVDEFQLMMYPVAIEEGTPLLKDSRQKIELKLVSTKTFNSGAVLLTYTPLGNEPF